MHLRSTAWGDPKEYITVLMINKRFVLHCKMNFSNVASDLNTWIIFTIISLHITPIGTWQMRVVIKITLIISCRSKNYIVNYSVVCITIPCMYSTALLVLKYPFPLTTPDPIQITVVPFSVGSPGIVSLEFCVAAPSVTILWLVIKEDRLNCSH